MSTTIPELLVKLSPERRRRVLLRTAALTLVSMLLSIVMTGAGFAAAGVDPSPYGYAVAAVIPACLAGPTSYWLFTKVEQIRQACSRLDVLASTDWLTQCLNRRGFTVAARTAIANASAAALLIIDADNFKDINDRFGHGEGDRALQAITAAISGTVADGDLVGRLGGEEFGVLVVDRSAEDVAAMAERIRAAVAAAPFSPDGTPHPLSVSIGVALHAGNGLSFEALLRAADQRLYEAKRAGRGRSVMGNVPDAPAPLAA